jgi:hypothetical protein
VRDGGEPLDLDEAAAPRPDEDPVAQGFTWPWQSSKGRCALGLALLIAAVVLPLLRQRGTPTWDTLWSEDGSIFVYQAIWHGSLHSLGQGYNGYLQFAPRLMAMPTPYFPVRYLAIYASVVPGVAGALLSWFVYHFTKGWVVSRLMRLALASLVVVMPALGLETTGTLTNSIWLFLTVLPWALISLQESRRAVVLRSIVAFLGVTASALGFLFAPLAIGWLVYRRTRAALVVMVAYGFGALVQGVVTLISPAAFQAFPVVDHARELRDDIGARVFGIAALGTRWEADLWQANWRLVVIGGPLLVLVLLAVVAPGAGRRAQAMAATLVATALVMFVVPVWGRGTNMGMVEAARDSQGSTRFSVVPVMLLASAFAILISSPDAVPGRLATRVGQPVFLAQVLLVGLSSFSLAPGRGLDPGWVGRVDAVVARDCRGRPGSTTAVVPNFTVKIPILPLPPGGYAPLKVRCSNL